MAAFDRLYVHAMAAGHRNTVETFENYAVTGKDPAVQVFAQQMLPTLKHHLAEIESIDARIRDMTK
jgi:putative membrane protein